MSKPPKYTESTINDAVTHLRDNGINPVKTTWGWNVTLRRVVPLPGSGRDWTQIKQERFTDVGIVEMAVNKGFKAPKGGSDWEQMREVAKNHIIKVTEDYIYKWGNHRDVLRHPTKKKIAELNAVGGEDWYRSFLEPETLARMGK